MSSTKHDRQERIRWLYRLLDRAVARVDPHRLDDYPERRTLTPEPIPTQKADSYPDHPDC